MNNPIEVANDIKVAIAELANGLDFYELFEAVDSLAAMACANKSIAFESVEEQDAAPQA